MRETSYEACGELLERGMLRVEAVVEEFDVADSRCEVRRFVHHGRIGKQGVSAPQSRYKKNKGA